MTRSTGLDAFKKKIENNPTFTEDAAQPITRTRAKGNRVSLTLRLGRNQWERLHQLGVSEGTSLQELCLKGLSLVFKEKGLPPI